MLISIIIILLVWFTPMPLWLSITATILAGFNIILKISRWISDELGDGD